MHDIMVDFDEENFLVLRKGVIAPNFFAKREIFFEFVETRTSPNDVFKQDLILSSRIYLLPNFFRFLFLILFEPDLAGMMNKTLFFEFKFICNVNIVLR